MFVVSVVVFNIFMIMGGFSIAFVIVIIIVRGVVRRRIAVCSYILDGVVHGDRISNWHGCRTYVDGRKHATVRWINAISRWISLLNSFGSYGRLCIGTSWLKHNVEIRARAL